MTHTKPSFAGHNANNFYDPTRQSSFGPRAPHTFPRKRNRSEFEPIPDTHHENPAKKSKHFHPNYDNPHQPPQTSNPPSNHRTFEDDIKHNPERKRTFQNGGVEKATKQRRQNIIKQRREQRQHNIHQKHQNVIKTRMYNPANWNFNMSNNTSHASHHTFRESSIDSMDSDEVMTEYATNDENHNQSNIMSNPPFNNNTNDYYFASRHSCIPQTCPNPRKYRSRKHDEPSAQPPSECQSQPQMNEMNSNPFPNHETPPPMNSDQIDSHTTYNPCYINTNINTQNVQNSDANYDAFNDSKEEENRRDLEEKRRKKEEKKKAQDELVAKRAEKRIEDMKNDKINEANMGRRKDELRDKIHPFIIQKAHVFKNNPIELIKLFYPKTRITHNASTKDILKAFKRALAHFHPDRTINKTLEEQIEAEEVFKLLSQEKEVYEKKQNEPSVGNGNHYNRYNGGYNKHRKQKRHGWF
eukprot:391518_1